MSASSLGLPYAMSGTNLPYGAAQIGGDSGRKVGAGWDAVCGNAQKRVFVRYLGRQPARDVRDDAERAVFRGGLRGADHGRAHERYRSTGANPSAPDAARYNRISRMHATLVATQCRMLLYCSSVGLMYILLRTSHMVLGRLYCRTRCCCILVLTCCMVLGRLCDRFGTAHVLDAGMFVSVDHRYPPTGILLRRPLGDPRY